MKKALFVAATALTVLAAAPAQATIVLANPSAFNGEEILFNGPNDVISGQQLIGHTNQSNTKYVFTGTTSDGSNNLSGDTGGGQATVTPFANNSYLTGLTYYRLDGGLFNDSEFRFVKPIVNSLIYLYGYNQNNVAFCLDADGNDNVCSPLALGGDNRFGIQGINGDDILKVSYVITTGGVEGHKQTRLDNVVPGGPGGGGNNPGGVPEPATWAMMLLGFGAIGAAMRRRAPVRVKFA